MKGVVTLWTCLLFAVLLAPHGASSFALRGHHLDERENVRKVISVVPVRQVILTKGPISIPSSTSYVLDQHLLDIFHRGFASGIKVHWKHPRRPLYDFTGGSWIRLGGEQRRKIAEVLAVQINIGKQRTIPVRVPVEVPAIPKYTGNNQLVQNVLTLTVLQTNIANLFGYLLSMFSIVETDSTLYNALLTVYKALLRRELNVESLLPMLQTIFYLDVKSQLNIILPALMKTASGNTEIALQELLNKLFHRREESIWKLVVSAPVNLSVTNSIQVNWMHNINTEGTYTDNPANILRKYFAPLIKWACQQQDVQLLKQIVYFLLLNFPLPGLRIDIVISIRNLAPLLFGLNDEFWLTMMQRIEKYTITEVNGALRDFLLLILTIPNVSPEVTAVILIILQTLNSSDKAHKLPINPKIIMYEHEEKLPFSNRNPTVHVGDKSTTLPVLSLTPQIIIFPEDQTLKKPYVSSEERRPLSFQITSPASQQGQQLLGSSRPYPSLSEHDRPGEQSPIVLYPDQDNTEDINEETLFLSSNEPSRTADDLGISPSRDSDDNVAYPTSFDQNLEREQSRLTVPYHSEDNNNKMPLSMIYQPSRAENNLKVIPPRHSKHTDQDRPGEQSSFTMDQENIDKDKPYAPYEPSGADLEIIPSHYSDNKPYFISSDLDSPAEQSQFITPYPNLGNNAAETQISMLQESYNPDNDLEIIQPQEDEENEIDSSNDEEGQVPVPIQNIPSGPDDMRFQQLPYQEEIQQYPYNDNDKVEIPFLKPYGFIETKDDLGTAKLQDDKETQPYPISPNEDYPGDQHPFATKYAKNSNYPDQGNIREEGLISKPYQTFESQNKLNYLNDYPEAQHPLFAALYEQQEYLPLPQNSLQKYNNPYSESLDQYSLLELPITQQNQAFPAPHFGIENEIYPSSVKQRKPERETPLSFYQTLGQHIAFLKTPSRGESERASNIYVFDRPEAAAPIKCKCEAYNPYKQEFSKFTHGGKNYISTASHIEGPLLPSIDNGNTLSLSSGKHIKPSIFSSPGEYEFPEEHSKYENGVTFSSYEEYAPLEQEVEFPQTPPGYQNENIGPDGSSGFGIQPALPFEPGLGLPAFENPSSQYDPFGSVSELPEFPSDFAIPSPPIEYEPSKPGSEIPKDSSSLEKEPADNDGASEPNFGFPDSGIADEPSDQESEFPGFGDEPVPPFLPSESGSGFPERSPAFGNPSVSPSTQNISFSSDLELPETHIYLENESGLLLDEYEHFEKNSGLLESPSGFENQNVTIPDNAEPFESGLGYPESPFGFGEESFLPSDDTESSEIDSGLPDGLSGFEDEPAPPMEPFEPGFGLPERSPYFGNFPASASTQNISLSSDSEFPKIQLYLENESPAPPDEYELLGKNSGLPESSYGIVKQNIISDSTEEYKPSLGYPEGSPDFGKESSLLFDDVESSDIDSGLPDGSSGFEDGPASPFEPGSALPEHLLAFEKPPATPSSKHESFGSVSELPEFPSGFAIQSLSPADEYEPSKPGSEIPEDPSIFENKPVLPSDNDELFEPDFEFPEDPSGITDNFDSSLEPSKEDSGLPDGPPGFGDKPATQFESSEPDSGLQEPPASPSTKNATFSPDAKLSETQFYFGKGSSLPPDKYEPSESGLENLDGSPIFGNKPVLPDFGFPEGPSGIADELDSSLEPSEQDSSVLDGLSVFGDESVAPSESSEPDSGLPEPPISPSAQNISFSPDTELPETQFYFGNESASPPDEYESSESGLENPEGPSIFGNEPFLPDFGFPEGPPGIADEFDSSLESSEQNSSVPDGTSEFGNGPFLEPYDYEVPVSESEKPQSQENLVNGAYPPLFGGFKPHPPVSNHEGASPTSSASYVPPDTVVDLSFDTYPGSHIHHGRPSMNIYDLLPTDLDIKYDTTKLLIRPSPINPESLPQLVPVCEGVENHHLCNLSSDIRFILQHSDVVNVIALSGILNVKMRKSSADILVAVMEFLLSYKRIPEANWISKIEEYLKYIKAQDLFMRNTGFVMNVLISELRKEINISGPNEMLNALLGWLLTDDVIRLLRLLPITVYKSTSQFISLITTLYIRMKHFNSNESVIINQILANLHKMRYFQTSLVDIVLNIFSANGQFTSSYSDSGTLGNFSDGAMQSIIFDDNDDNTQYVVSQNTNSQFIESSSVSTNGHSSEELVIGPTKAYTIIKEALESLNIQHSDIDIITDIFRKPGAMKYIKVPITASVSDATRIILQKLLQLSDTKSNQRYIELLKRVLKMLEISKLSQHQVLKYFPSLTTSVTSYKIHFQELIESIASLYLSQNQTLLKLLHKWIFTTQFNNLLQNSNFNIAKFRTVGDLLSFVITTLMKSSAVETDPKLAELIETEAERVKQIGVQPLLKYLKSNAAFEKL